jgi:hypothetical protein
LNDATYRRNVKSLNSPHYVIAPPPTHSTRLTYRSYVELYFGMRVPPIGGNCIPNAIIKSIPNADKCYVISYYGSYFKIFCCAQIMSLEFVFWISRSLSKLFPCPKFCRYGMYYTSTTLVPLSLQTRKY